MNKELLLVRKYWKKAEKKRNRKILFSDFLLGFNSGMKYVENIIKGNEK